MDLGFMRWLTVRVPGDAGRENLLEKPGPPAMDEATAAPVRELITKGASGFTVGFSTPERRKTYDPLKARDVEFTQEPTERFYGIDCGLRDPFGNRSTGAVEGRTLVLATVASTRSFGNRGAAGSNQRRENR
jgi:hypothetical protein